MINKIGIISIIFEKKMLKKGITKTRISITLDTELVEFLNKECEERTMKLSNYIQKLIKIGVKNEK